ncbi:MAG: SurA N-terminal domain-containing protein [Candidatus Fermentibacteraceae bacterium]|nr:SurA N-terminal domain-containing protein [Candidatus Fermentibacteraceae bacterium]MBN2609861.1 SurA N-terminal domain-containing protein [Candidatus Fermentibacteraceae bacterium]
MLTWLRDNAKIFLIATIVIFVALIFLRWGMGEDDVQPRNPYQRPVATVDGKRIMPDQYQQALQSMSQRYRNVLESSNNPDPEAMMMLMGQRLSEEAFRGLIDAELQGIYLRRQNWDQFTVPQAEELLVAQIGMQDLGDMTAREYLEMIRSEQPGAYQQYLYQTYISGNSMLFPMAAGMVSMASLDEVRYMEMETQAQITARYMTVDSTPPMPDEEYLREFYDSRGDYFIRPAGSLLRYIIVQVPPVDQDMQFALERLDSLTFASPGVPVASNRAQLASFFGDTLDLQPGQRTEPFLGMYSGNSSISSFHVLMLDSIRRYDDTLNAGGDSFMLDTLFLRSWEVPVFPGYNTIRNLMWDLESEMETMLAENIPDMPDTMIILDFGEMLVNEDTPLSVNVPEEMVVFAGDTLWNDPMGPVFYSPSYRGGYPAFTAVRRLTYYSPDTLDYTEALNSGMLMETAVYHLRREAAMEKAGELLELTGETGMNLAAVAEAESLHVWTTEPFTAAEIKSNAQTDPDAAGGILFSEDFAMASITAPEFQVIGPFATGPVCVLAEILSRQAPVENQSIQAIAYISTEYGHQQLASAHILESLRETVEVRDLREEWTQYLESVEDSLRAEQEQLEE